MTFIAGYIYQGAVHLIADSAETISNEHLAEMVQSGEHESTMFESTVVAGSEVVVENANKIYNLHDRILLGFAGSVSEGIRIVQELLDMFAAFVNIKQQILDFFEAHKPMHTQYIIGFIEDQQPYMYCYHRPKEELMMSGNLSICSIGRNEWIPPETFVSMVSHAFANSHSHDDLLITAISAMQVTTQGLRTLESGVGGHINGAYIASTGIHWAKDTTYILYSSVHLDKPKTIHVVYKFNRDNAVFVRSDLNQLIFITEINNLSRQALNDKWGTPLQKLANAAVTDYYVLLSYETGIAFLVNNSNNNSCKVFVEDGVFKFPPDLVKANTVYYA